MDAIELIKYFLGGLSVFVVGYLLYQYKLTQARIKSLEDGLSNQNVINQKFTDYQDYKDKQDDLFKESVNKIGTKIDELIKSFDDKFKSLTRDIHKMEVDFANKTKK